MYVEGFPIVAVDRVLMLYLQEINIILVNTYGKKKFLDHSCYSKLF